MLFDKIKVMVRAAAMSQSKIGHCFCFAKSYFNYQERKIQMSWFKLLKYLSFFFKSYMTVIFFFLVLDNRSVKIKKI